MRDKINMDIERLNKEDRRFLLQKNSSEILHYEQMLLNNNMLKRVIVTLVISSLAFVISIFSLDKNIPRFIQIGVILFLITGAIIYLKVNFKKYENSKKKIEEDKKRLISNSSNLFRLHFRYATKKI